MRIRCLITRSFLTRYLSGEVGRHLVRFLRAHIEECEGCRDRMRESVVRRERYSRLQAPHVTEAEWEELWSTILDRVEAEESEGIPPRGGGPIHWRRGRSRYVLLAAAAALLVFGAFLRLTFSGNQAQQTSISTYIQYHEDAVDGYVLLENHFWSAQALPVTYAAVK